MALVVRLRQDDAMSTVRFVRCARVLLLGFAACSVPNRHLPATGALGPYSAAVMSGELCFVSGKIGAKRDATFTAEVESAIDALESELDRAKLSLDDVVLVNVYLTEMSHYAELNTVYAKRFREPFPARACVAVAALPGGARVEIQAIARVGD
jgi:2-iminobutanoate/2-iminopropanoate deaminase